MEAEGRAPVIDEHVRLCCSGPSLAEWLPLAPCACTVGVNYAAQAIPCDWWVIGDEGTWGLVDPIGRPRVMAPRAGALRAGKVEGVDFEAWSVAVKHAPRKLAWRGWHKSGPAGLVLAVSLAKEMGLGLVRVYGMDMLGDCDFRGVWSRGGDLEPRWELEREYVRRIVSWAEGEVGVVVERLGRLSAAAAV